MARIQPRVFPQKLFWLFRYLGWYRALIVCAVKPFDLMTKRFTKSKLWKRFVESQFDSKYGVDTFEIVPVAMLDIRDVRKEEANFYEPTPIMRFGHVISQLSISYSDFSFVDIGSGKGRTLLLASWFPFKRIVGVEISPRLHQIAELNISRYQGPRMCNDIKSVCEDAGVCSFPGDPMILFLYNPFQENVLKLFLQNLHRSLLENQRCVILIYANPIHRKVIENTEWLAPAGMELDDWCLIYETNQSLVV